MSRIGVAAFIGVYFMVVGCDPSEKTYRLTTSSEPYEGGQVIPIDTLYSEGSLVEIEAIPSEGYFFRYWEGDLSDSLNPVTIEIDQDLNVVGVFEKKSYPLEVAVEGEGKVEETIIVPKVNEYEHGTVVELSAVAPEKWEFKEWSGDITSTENPVIITVDDQKRITAHFDQVEFTVQGRIFDVFLGDTLGIQPEVLSINGEDVPVTEEGIFETVVNKGNTSIEVTSSNHEQYLSEIQISEHTEKLEIVLNPIMIDYYNFSWGDKWIYDYEYNFRGRYFDEKISAEMIWEITNREIYQLKKDTVFKVQYSLKGKYTKWNYTGILDSSEVDQSTSFDIKINEIGEVIFLDLPIFGDIFSPINDKSTITFYDDTKIETHGSVNRFKLYPLSRSKNEEILLDNGGNGEIKKSEIIPLKGIKEHFKASPPFNSGAYNWGIKLREYTRGE